MNKVTHGNRLRDLATALHNTILKSGVEQPNCPVRNLFAPGVWLREMCIPAGVVVTGAVHKHEHFAILSKGTVRLSTESGIQEFVAPATIHSYPGIKRICFAVSDACITTIHHNPSNTTDLDELVPMAVEATAAELMGGYANTQIINNVIAKELSK